jgi:hypothetical protein
MQTLIRDLPEESWRILSIVLRARGHKTPVQRQIAVGEVPGLAMQQLDHQVLQYVRIRWHMRAWVVVRPHGRSDAPLAPILQPAKHMLSRCDGVEKRMSEELLQVLPILPFLDSLRLRA